MRTLLIPCLFAATASCVIIADDSSLTIRNHSSHLLTQLFVADTGERSWGPNLLDWPLNPGDSFEVDHLYCGHYDVLVSNERNIDCMLTNLHLCFDDRVWTIDDATLQTCAWTP
jgi:hypothetical protein